MRPPVWDGTQRVPMRWDEHVERARDDRIVDEQSVAEQVVRGAITAFRTHAFHTVDVGVVAGFAEVDPEVVTRVFPAWDALLLVTYDRWVELRASLRRERPGSTIEYVRLTLTEDVADPGLVRVLAGVINIAGATTSFTELFRKRYEEYAAALAAGLQHDFDAGVEVSVVPAEHAATQLLAVYEGLQIQMLVRPHLDVVAEYDRAAQTLRDGWRRRPVSSWDVADDRRDR